MMAARAMIVAPLLGVFTFTIFSLLSCGQQDTFITHAIDVDHLGQPANDEIPGLPESPFPGRLAANLDLSALTEDTQVVSEGAAWNGDTVSLRSPGLSYTMLATIAPVYDLMMIIIHGDADELWLAVSDYPEKRWRWLDQPVSGSDIRYVPADVKMNPAGELYILLVCPDGVSAAVSVSRMFSFETDLLPDDLGFSAVVPPELEDTYEYVRTLTFEERRELRESDNDDLRRALIYFESNLETPSIYLSRNQLSFYMWAENKDDATPLIKLIFRQLGCTAYRLDYVFWDDKQGYSLTWPRELLPADRAWIREWMYQHYKGAYYHIDHVGIGFPGG